MYFSTSFPSISLILHDVVRIFINTTEVSCQYTIITKFSITHEKIANHLGTAREVVTRMLRYFQSEGLVKLSRGTIELTDKKRLEEISE